MAGPAPKGAKPVPLPLSSSMANGVPLPGGVPLPMGDTAAAAPSVIPFAGQAPIAGPKMTPLGQTSIGSSTQQDSNPSDPISWVLDMLDRPRRAVADTLDSVVTGGIDAAAGIKDLANGTFDKNGDAAKWQSDAFQMLPGVGAARGLFSTNAADQQTTGQMIEKGVDQYGHNFDPHYKDTQDNVNPVLKGALGFAGDVASDPFTYMGIGELADGVKIARGVLKGEAGLAAGAKGVAKHLGNYTGVTGLVHAGKAAAALPRIVKEATKGDKSSLTLLDDLTRGDANDAARAASEAAPAEQPWVRPLPEGGTTSPVSFHTQPDADVIKAMNEAKGGGESWLPGGFDAKAPFQEELAKRTASREALAKSNLGQPVVDILNQVTKRFPDVESTKLAFQPFHEGERLPFAYNAWTNTLELPDIPLPEMGKQLLADDPHGTLLSAAAKSLGVDSTTLTPEDVARFAITHELAHAVDHLGGRNDALEAERVSQMETLKKTHAHGTAEYDQGYRDLAAESYADQFAGRLLREVSVPKTDDGIAHAMTDAPTPKPGPAEPVAAASWTKEQETQLSRQQKKLTDLKARARPIALLEGRRDQRAIEKLQDQVDGLLAKKYPGGAPVAAAEAAAPAEVVPTGDSPVQEAAPAAPTQKPISTVLAKSPGESVRGTEAYNNAARVVGGLAKIRHNGGLSLVDAFVRERAAGNLDEVLGKVPSFAAQLQKLSDNPAKFDLAVSEFGRILQLGGHLDSTDFGTKLTSTRALLRSMFADSPVNLPKVRKLFLQNRATVESVSAAMASTVRPLSETDQQAAALVHEWTKHLRTEKPELTNRTAQGAMSSGGDTKKSWAEFRDRTNTHSQWGLLRGAVNKALKSGGLRIRAQAGEIGGARRSTIMRQHVMGDPLGGDPAQAGVLGKATMALDKAGVSHTIDAPGGLRANLSAYQAYHLIADRSLEAQRAMDKALFNGGVKTAEDGTVTMKGTPVATTKLLEAITKAVFGADRATVLSTLMEDTKRSREGTAPNFLASKAEGQVDHQLTNQPRYNGAVGEHPVQTGPGRFDIRQSPEALANELADHIMASVDDLKGAHLANGEDYAQRFADETHKFTVSTMAVLDQWANDPTKVADMVRGIVNPAKVVAEVATEGREDSKAAAAVIVEATTPDVTVKTAKATKTMAEKTVKGDRKGAQQAAQEKSDVAAKDAEQAFKQQQEEEFAANLGIQPEEVAAARAADEAAAAATTPGAPNPFAEGGDAEHIPTDDEYDVDAKTTLGRITGERKGFSPVKDPDQTDARIQNRVAATVQAVVHPILKAANTVVRGLGIDELHTGRLGILRRMSREYAGLSFQLSQLDKQVDATHKISDIVLNDALRRVASDPAYAEQRAIVDKMVAHWMGAGVDGKGTMLAEPYLREGIPPKYLWDVLVDHGIIPKERDFFSEGLGDYITGDKAGSGSTAGSIANWIVSNKLPVKIPDAYDFLNRMMTATTEFSMHAGIARDLVSQGHSLGFLKTEGGPGWKRIVGNKQSLFSHVLTLGGEAPVWADPESAAAINRVADMLKPDGKMSSELHSILQAFDDVQQAWKYGETAIRPGTHLHNYVSDHIMTWLAEGAGGMKTGMVNATKMLAANHREGGVPVEDLIASVNGITRSATGYKGPGDVLFRGRGDTQFTAHTAFLLYSDAGLAASSRAVQRTDSEHLSGFGKLMEKFYQSPLGKKIDLLNEVQEDHVRLTHFSVALQKALDKGYVETRWGKRVSVYDKGGNLNYDVLKTAIGQRVRRFHPDPNMLTGFERSWIRRVMPFYQWTRGAIPAVIESAYLHPGRALSINKLSFNVGLALGVGGNSLADPYPNGAWPGFLTQQMQGPQANINGSMFTVNPGIPTWDVANMFTDPNQINGSLSPLLSIPLEVATGQNSETHEPITNWYDAIDSNIPLVANVDSATGISTTGSLVGALTGRGIQHTSNYMQQHQDPDQPLMTALSYGFGQNTTHVTKPSYTAMGVAQQQQRLSQIMAGISPANGF